MDWQQPAALLVVALALVALIRNSLRNRGKSCPGNCSCPPNPAPSPGNRRRA